MKPTSPSESASPGPWYREPWPWIIMAIPALSVFAGVAMLWLAIRSNDGLVADDYYRRGLAINQDLSRARRAAELGLKAEISLGEGASRIRVQLMSSTDASLPPALQLRLAHGTRAGYDQSVLLRRIAPGLYEGPIVPPTAGRWQVLMEEGSGEWRFAGSWQVPRDETIVVDAATATSVP